jgi:putative ABC transport system permease protein
MNEPGSGFRGESIVRWLLLLYPLDFRRDHQDEIVDFLRREHRRAGSRVRFWARIVSDLALGALRMALSRPRRGMRARPERKEDISAWLRDLRFAARSLRKTPLTSFSAMVLLALGVGLNTAIFSFVYAVALRPLPYDRPERLVSLWNSSTGLGFDRVGLSEGEFARFDAEVTTLEDVGVYVSFSMTLSGLGDPVQLPVAAVSATALRALALPPGMGRYFLEEETAAEPAPVALLSHDAWQRRLGADPAVLGRTIGLDGRQVAIVGVMPPGFQLPQDLGIERRPELWIPLALDRANLNWGSFYLSAVGRMRPGVSLDEVRAEVGTVVARIARDHPEVYPRDPVRTPRVEPLTDDLAAGVLPALAFLGISVLLLLLLASTNVVNLLLMKLTSRRRELAIRTALGAGRLQILRLFVTESFLLAAGGALFGLIGAAWLPGMVTALVPSRVPRLSDASLEPPVLAFALGLSLLLTAVVAAIPLWQAGRGAVLPALADRGRGSVAAPARRLCRMLVASEVALTMALIVAAGLLLKSFIHLNGVPPGFDPERVLAVRTILPEARYAGIDSIEAFHRRLAEELSALPGVRSVAAANAPPLVYGGDTFFDLEDGPSLRDQAGPDAFRQHFFQRTVSPGYFETLGIPLARGRTLGEADAAGGLLTVVINETMARRFFADRDPIGKRLRKYWRIDRTSPWLTIVGVVEDAKVGSLDEEPLPEIYVPLAQAAESNSYLPYSMTTLIRADVASSNLSSAARTIIRRLDPEVPVADIATMEEIVAGTLAAPRFNLVVAGAFAIVALVVGVVGVYAVFAYFVGQRRGEIAVRMALGANRGDVRRLVGGEAARLIAAGLLLGAASAFALTRAMESLLFDVVSTDAATWLSVTLLVTMAAAGAVALPVRLACRVSPVSVLREEGS